MTHGSELSEADLVQSICRESFYRFVREFWSVVITEKPVWNWHIPYLCGELQLLAERVFLGLPKEHDVVINIPPGTTKSTICNIMFPPWVWTRMPSARILTASFDHLLALGFSRKSRDVVLSPAYQNAFRFKKNEEGLWIPSVEEGAEGVSLAEDQNTKGLYENMARGTRQAIGTAGNITGYHFHIILCDDLINPKKAVTEAGLREANYFMSETLPSRKVDKAVTPTALIMQRLHQDDPTGHWLEKRKEKIKHICLPERIRPNIKPARLVKYYRAQGGLLDPVRLSEEVLKDQELELGSYGYAGQYGQDPAPLGGGMFEVENIKIAIPPKLEHFVKLVRYWDKAATQASKGPAQSTQAESAGVLMGLDTFKRVWWLDVVHGAWSVHVRNQNMKQTAEMDGFSVLIGIEQEPGSGGKESAQSSMIDVLPGYRVVLDRPTGDKVTRAEPLAGQVGIGNTYVPAGVPWWAVLREQLRFFPLGKLKDIVDASSGAHQLLRGVKQKAGSMFTSAQLLSPQRTALLQQKEGELIRK